MQPRTADCSAPFEQGRKERYPLGSPSPSGGLVLPVRGDGGVGGLCYFWRREGGWERAGGGGREGGQTPQDNATSVVGNGNRTHPTATSLLFQKPTNII